MTLTITENDAVAAARRIVADPRYARFSTLEQYGVCALLVRLVDASIAAQAAPADASKTALEKEFTHDPQ